MENTITYSQHPLNHEKDTASVNAETMCDARFPTNYKLLIIRLIIVSILSLRNEFIYQNENEQVVEFKK